MQIGTDGSVQTPDPDTIETLTPVDVGTVSDALERAPCVSAPQWDERRRVALAKFRRIWESNELDQEDVEADPDLHHHYLSSGGQTLTHTHPDGRRSHEGRDNPAHRGWDRGAYYSHPGPGGRQGNRHQP